MFSPAARKQGRLHASGGDVQIDALGETSVVALVRDDRLHTSAADLSVLDAPVLRCTCVAWERWGPCKHLWATLLEADRSGIACLQAAGETPAEPAREESPPDWEGRLDALAEALARRAAEPVLRTSSEVVYVLDRERSRRAHAPVVSAFVRRRLRSGRWGILRALAGTPEDEQAPLAPSDRRVLAALRGASDAGRDGAADTFLLDPEQTAVFLPLLAATRRLVLDEPGVDEALRPLRYEDSPPWRLETCVEPLPRGDRVRLVGRLVRGTETLALDAADLVLGAGLVVARGVAAPLGIAESAPWLQTLLDEGPIVAPAADAEELAERVLALPAAPPVHGTALEMVHGVAPRPHLEASGGVEAGPGWVDCRIYAAYGGDAVRLGDPASVAPDAEGRRRIARDRDAERRAAAVLLEHPDALPPQASGGDLALPATALVALLPRLLDEGWTVEAAGRRYRSAGRMRASVASGIDWFGVQGGIEFDGEVAPLPELLRAVRAGSRTVRLGDGSLGLLPEDVLRSWGLLAALGRVEDDGLRFGRHQGWIIEALLAGRRGVDVDAEFERYRERIRGFDGIEPRQEPASFRGTLRGYQREGLAWLDFLREFGCGGCLADDMGLGKTVQVLAMLEERRTAETSHGPSLVVAPRSVVFNWIDESARFTPELRVLDYTGGARRASLDDFAEYDLVVTTYGVLRRDAEQLAATEFDYAILDESQAVKNHATQASRAARALRARHRLALSGTPLENHLSELWALFEFLNPGMLGRSATFRRLAQKSSVESIDREGRALLARALRPFLLRRTKEQVATDLPEKTEQTLHCEMPAKQRRLYRELAAHYRGALLGGGAAAALAGSRMHVLEALLRLRQAACHPGLLDPEREDEDCAKLDALLPLLEEVVAEGHKALVFSQFTSLLAIVRKRLEAAGLVHEYLDGQTRDRRERVERFQTDAACPVFLISLRAGGLGLNLTAADYVFILDPWWNPAVEAQAIDRSHRIGQTRHVMAYRLVCRDSVEEKILALQDKKRDLADAILSDDNALLADLSPEDLELLLSS